MPGSSNTWDTFSSNRSIKAAHHRIGIGTEVDTYERLKSPLSNGVGDDV
jgi:hypothetical protein